MFKSTIRIKIFAYIFSLTMLSLVVISMAVYFLLFQTLKNNETQNAVKASDKTKQSMEFVLKLIASTGTQLGANNELSEELHKPYLPNSADYIVGQNKISTMLQNIISVQGYIKGIYVISPKGNFYTSNWGVKESELKSLYASYVDNGDKAEEYFTGIHNVTYHPALKSNVISYIRPIFDLESSKILGAIIIDIDYDLLKEMFTISSIENDEKVLVVSPNAETIFTYPNVILDDVIKNYPVVMTEKKAQINGKVFGNDSIIISNTVEYTNWKAIRIISSQKIHRETNMLEKTAVYVFFVFLFICFAASLALSSALTNPIKELNMKFKLVENGNLAARASIHSKDELGELSHSFNHMVEKLKISIDSLLEEQKKKSDMEFQILQAQINPHFLYNTLDSIKWLAVIQNVSTISDMTTALINLLKYNISKKSTTVSLSEELESVSNYAKIQKYRYGDIFNIEYSIEEDTKDCEVLRFILQPIVENAIIHGFENVESQGMININTKTENDTLIIEVIDNGAGMDHKVLQNIITGDISKSKFSGIGVQNIQERIRAYFGENYGLSYESTPGLGTKATLVLPYIHH
ncbi:MAG: sensor histidine kinase [Clostridia bacterium]|nr:sensor histidine kinase [Clostridia bacterium]